MNSTSAYMSPRSAYMNPRSAYMNPASAYSISSREMRQEILRSTESLTQVTKKIFRLYNEFSTPKIEHFLPDSPSIQPFLQSGLNVKQLSQSLLETQSLLQTFPLESPFAWKTERYTLTRQINFFPKGSNPTISFTANRNSKILGYIPIIGSFIGIHRIFKGVQEYNLFNNTHLHTLSKRSIKWIARGILESVPVLGGITCMIIDAIATILSRTSPNLIRFEDETPCGHCHICGFCKC
ncbi:MAG: hypothetical protein ACXU9U_01395 [Parachlamydiaceae bacterium]